MFEKSNELIVRDQYEIPIYNRTYLSLKYLFLNSAIAQNTQSKEYDLSYLKEFCTIRIIGPRRSGHTFALLKLIREYNLNGAILVQNRKILNRTKQYFINSDETPLFLIESLDLLRGSSYQFIAVDGASIVKAKQMIEIYNLCSCCLVGNPVFVILIE